MFVYCIAMLIWNAWNRKFVQSVVATGEHRMFTRIVWNAV